MTTPTLDRSKHTAVRARVDALLEDEQQVTAEQRAAVLHAGSFLLEACPGSGKTRTIGLRTAWASVDGAGRIVAATSYTNAAVSEIQRAATAAGAPITEPHFVGTLHSFFLRYVFYPFAGLVMGCIGLPRVAFKTYMRSEAEQVFLPGQRVPVPLSNFEFAANGRLVVTKVPTGVTFSPEQAERLGYRQAAELKAKLAAQGVATPNDSMHYVQLVLEAYPEIAAAVAVRFDELIVDEAQDTNDIQLRCLQLLHATNQLGSLVLVGDFDQAIYSFSRADPRQCRAFADACRLHTLRLTQNFRSSQAICDVTHRFSSRSSPDIARGQHRNFGIRPEILRYNPRELEQLRSSYRRRLNTLGIEAEHACVLVRTSSLADRLNGIPATREWPAVRVLGGAATTIEAGGEPDAIMIGTIEHLLATLAWGDEVRQNAHTQQRRALRDQTIALLGTLPGLDQPITTWIAETRNAVAAVLGHLTNRPIIAPGHRLRSASSEDRRTARAAFADTLPRQLQAHTIHSVKGESRDAVLLVADLRRGERDHARAWVTSQATHETAEEIRIAYVALTRARRYLAIALPNSCPRDVVALYLDRGFTLATG